MPATKDHSTLVCREARLPDWLCLLGAGQSRAMIPGPLLTLRELEHPVCLLAEPDVPLADNLCPMEIAGPALPLALDLELEVLSTTELKQAQETLKLLGFDAGPSDGQFGSKTRVAYQAYQRDHAPPPAAADFPERMVEVAEAEIGTKEEGGNNRGPRIREYQAATWLPPGPWPWCAAFVCWTIREALDRVGICLFRRPRTAAAFGFADWARKEKQMVFKPGVKPARRGDLVIFSFSHIGIVADDEAKSGSFAAVEGNTNLAGSRDSRYGDGVYFKNRNTKSVKCFVRFSLAKP